MAKGPIALGGHRAPRPAAGLQEVVVWDPLVRLTHWAVAAAVLSNHLLNRAGGTWHVWIGWGVMALLAVRFAWGFVGPKEARFSSFLPNPMAALRHLGALRRHLSHKRAPVPHYASHNPAGAMMIYALWGMLAVVCLTGLVMTDGASPVRIAEQQAIVESGDWGALVQDDKSADDAQEGAGFGRAWAGEVHEVAANLVALFALIHVAGVALESFALGRNLVRPMLRK